MHFVSPNFTHEKLESPDYLDIVDVFEDRMRGWFLTPAKQLLSSKTGVVAAVSLLTSYFEGIEIYRSGKDSHRASKEFFRRGFKRVFGVDSSGSHIFDRVVDSLYGEVRCGFAHDLLSRNRVFFSTVRPQAFNVTWPRKDGAFVTDGELESVIINPSRYCEAIELHFNKYIAALRNESDAEMKKNFLSAVDIKWALNQPGRIVGMSEAEFFRGGGA